MSAPQTIGISFRRATAVSIALHFLAIVAFLWVWTTPPRVPGPRQRAANEAVRISQITIAFREPRIAPAPESRPKPFAQPLLEHVRTAIVSAPKPMTVAIVRARNAVRAAKPRAQSQSHARMQSDSTNLIVDTNVQPPAAPISEARADLEPTAVPSVAVQPTTTPAVAVAAAQKSVEQTVEVPSGGWGQSFSRPIVADDEALASLRASVRAPDLSADIAVDDTGRATRVTLPTGLPDDVRADLEQRLLALRYVPAECNGLRCAAVLRIAL